MGLQRTRILVVDDRAADGECIARVLWDSQIPVLFFMYDEDKLLKLSEEKDPHKHHGVRVILLDINLSGSGHAGHQDYVMAEKVVRTLLHEDNGPWALITWSTFAGENSQELYEYLCERLPTSIRPISLTELDKTPYVGEDQAIPPALPESKHVKLYKELSKVLDKPDSLKILGGWERSVYACASEVIRRLVEPLWAQLDDRKELNTRLISLIIELARADAGAKLNMDNIAEPLYNVLGPLLVDRIVHKAPSPVKLPAKIPRLALPDEDWKYRLNSMLHWDVSHCAQGYSQPGNIFFYPSNSNLSRTLPAIDLRYDFIIRNFVDKNKAAKLTAEEAKGIENRCKLTLMDTTPPCDHAQDKAVWRTFIVGVKVPDDYRKFYYADKNNEKKIGEFIFSSPRMMDETGCFEFFFNSKLILMLQDEKGVIKQLGESMGRVREQLLRDILSWLSRQISRPGIVSF
jgi:CheY-like chemotaxis protein